MPANHSNRNCVITILIHSDETLFQNVYVTLLRRVAKDVTSSLLSWNKRNDFYSIHCVYAMKATTTSQPMKARVTNVMN